MVRSPQRRATAVSPQVSVHDPDLIEWRVPGKAGLALKTVREDRERGRFLGLVGFEPMVRSGLHQHLGVATSFILDGGLTDHQGAVRLHQAGINLAGATHDAIAYQKTLLMSRLEAPVIYPEDTGRDYALHTGPRFGSVRSPNPEMLPDINVEVDTLPQLPTSVAGVGRRMIFDYAPAGGAHRYCELTILGGSVTPAFVTRAPLELWVRGGDLLVGGKPALANCFVIVEPGATVALSSVTGALVQAWSEAPVDWADGAARPDPFGF